MLTPGKTISVENLKPSIKDAYGRTLAGKSREKFSGFAVLGRHIELRYIKFATNFLIIILYAKGIVLNESAIIRKC